MESTLVFDGKLFADTGNECDFGYDDRFSFTVWVKPQKTHRGDPLAYAPQEPQAEGYSVELIDGKVRVSLTKRWLDDALRVETANVVAPDKWQHLAVTYDGSRLAAGMKIFVDGVEQKTKVLLDELNQTFQNKEPFRIGTAGGSKRTGSSARWKTRMYRARPRTGRKSRSWRSRLPTSEFIGKSDDERTPGERTKIRRTSSTISMAPLRSATRLRRSANSAKSVRSSGTRFRPSW